MNTGPRVPATVGLRTVCLFWGITNTSQLYGKITILQNTELFNQLNIIHVYAI